MKCSILIGFAVLAMPLISKADFIYPCNGAAGTFRVNPDNTPGGFVAATATVDSTITLTPEASICERATVIEGVQLTDRAKISGKATIRGKVLIAGRAEVFGEAYLINPAGDQLIINENAKIYGHAFLQGSVIISGTSEVFGWGKVLDFAQMLGSSKICGNSILKGFDVLTDDSSKCVQK